MSEQKTATSTTIPATTDKKSDSSDPAVEGSSLKKKSSNNLISISSLSIRAKTIILLITLVVCATLVVVGTALAIVIVTFRGIETQTSQNDVFRFALLLRSSLADLQTSAADYAVWAETADAIDSVAQIGNTSILDEFIQNILFTDGVFNTYIGMNLVAFFGPTGDLLFAEYNPPNLTSGEPVSPIPSPLPPELSAPGFLESLGSQEYSGVINFAGHPSMMASAASIKADLEDPVVHGTLMFAFHFTNGLGAIANIVQACVTVWQPGNASSLTTDAATALASLAHAAADNSSEWGDTTYIANVPPSDLTDDRICPEADTQPKTSELNAGYFVIRDPIAGHAVGPVIRVDHHMVFLINGSGSLPVFLAIIIFGLVALAATTTAFLNRAVLRKLEKMNSFLVDAAAVTVTEPPANTAASGGSGDQHGRGDEINRLERMLRYKLELIGAELAAAAAAQADARQANERTSAALWMLNLLCGRVGAPPPEELLPPLRPQQSTFLTLEGLMERPLAIEFLKAHAKLESSIENVLFVLDIEQLRSMTAQFPDPQDAEAILGIAMAMHRRYFADSAPLSLNIDAHAKRKITKAFASGKVSSIVSAFEAVAGDVAQILRYDILPRFEISRGYVHMLRVLRTEIGGAPLEGPGVEVRTPRPETKHRSPSGPPLPEGELSRSRSSTASAGKGKITVVLNRLRTALSPSSDAMTATSPTSERPLSPRQHNAGSPGGSPSYSPVASPVLLSRRTDDSPLGAEIPLKPLGSSDSRATTTTTTSVRSEGETSPILPPARSPAIPAVQLQSLAASSVAKHSPLVETPVTTPDATSLSERTESPPFVLSARRESFGVIETQSPK